MNTTNRFAIVGRLGSISTPTRTRNGRTMARVGIMPLRPSPFAAAQDQWFSVTAWDDQLDYLIAAKNDRAQVEIVGTVHSYEREDTNGKTMTVLSLACAYPMRHRMVTPIAHPKTRDLVPSFTLVGQLGHVQNPTITAKGHEVGSFGIGLQKKVRTGIRGEDDPIGYSTEWLNIEAWGDIRAAAAMYRSNKREMHYDYVVSGRLEMRAWTPKGAQRPSTKLVVVATSIDIYTAAMRAEADQHDGQRDDLDTMRSDDDGVRPY